MDSVLEPSHKHEESSQLQNSKKGLSKLNNFPVTFNTHTSTLGSLYVQNDRVILTLNKTFSKHFNNIRLAQILQVQLKYFIG